MDKKIDPMSPSGYLQAYYGSYSRHNRVEHSRVAPFLAGYISLAQSNPDKVLDDVLIEFRHAESEKSSVILPRSPLLALIELIDCRYFVSKIDAWSTDIKDYIPPNVPDPEVNWVCAMLIARGANAWFNDPESLHKTPSAIAGLIELRSMGLLKNAFLQKDAWTADQLANSIFPPPRYSSTTNISCIQYLMSSPGCGPLLDVMLDHGMSFPFSDSERLSLLSVATPEAILTIFRRGILADMSAELGKSLREEWKNRVKAKDSDLPASVFSDLLSLLSSSTGSSKEQDDIFSQTTRLDKLLSPSWDKSFASFYQGSGLSLEELTEVGMSKSQLRGQWSGFAAHLMSLVRLGVVKWNAASTLKTEYSNSAWHLADLNAPEWNACLSGAIGFDWRPGISIDGPVMLALTAQDAPNQPDHWALSLKNFCLATGIPDAREWMKASVNAAADFTFEIIKPSAIAQHKKLLAVWSSSLKNFPELSTSLNEDRKIKVLQSCTGRFNHSCFWVAQGSGASLYKNEFESVFKSLFPTVSSSPNNFHLLGENDAKAALIRGLTTSQYADWINVVESSPSFNSLLDVLQDWAKAHAKNISKTDPFLALTRSLLLGKIVSETRSDWEVKTSLPAYSPKM